MATNEEIKDMSGKLLNMIKITPGTVPVPTTYLIAKLAAKIVDKKIAIVDLSSCTSKEAYFVQEELEGDGGIPVSIFWQNEEVGDDLANAIELRDARIKNDQYLATYRIIKRTTFDEVIEL